MIGLGTALDYVQRLGLPNIARHEHELLTYDGYGLVWMLYEPRRGHPF